MKKSQIDKAIALLEVQRQPFVDKLTVLNAAIEVLRRMQAAQTATAKSAKKPRQLRPVKTGEVAS